MARVAAIVFFVGTILLSGYVCGNGVRQPERVRTEMGVSVGAGFKNTVCFRHCVVPPGLPDFYLFDRAENSGQAMRQYGRVVKTKFKHSSEKVAAIKKQEEVLRSVYSARDFERRIIIQSRG